MLCDSLWALVTLHKTDIEIGMNKRQEAIRKWQEAVHWVADLGAFQAALIL